MAGLEKEEVDRLRLVNGRVEKADFDADMTLGRTDQILAGELFDLPNSFDSVTERYRDRYKDLLKIKEPTHEQQRELNKLGKQLESRIPPPAADLIARRSLELMEALDGSGESFWKSPQERAGELTEHEHNIFDRMAALRKALARKDLGA